MALTLTARLRVARRISRAALLAVVLAGGVAQASVVKQDFYLPIPENQLQLAFTTIHTGAGNTIDSVFSVVITAPNTVLYFDQWENGYENDLGSPTNVWSTANLGGTQIWGDGNDANGIPPGYVHDTNFPAGAVLTLRNYVTLPRNPAQILFDGRDHLGATKAIIMSRAGWASNIGPVQGCAVEVPSVSDHGQRYICPVGEDVVSYGKFQYVGLYIMGDYDGTTVTIDTDGAGPLAPLTVTLNRGTPYQVNGGIKKGAYVTASLPVQVYMATGDKTATYETRSFTLRPLEKWSSRYLTPVGTAGNGNPAVVFLFNTNPAPMTVAYTSRAASGLLTVPANNGVLEFQVPRSSGTLLVSTNGTVFSVICAAGADPANDYAYDWGFALLPFDGLTTEAIIGWGPGSADLTRNGSPVWATVTTNTTLYVDYHADYAGPLIDPAGHHYDVAYTLAALESKTIYGPGNDQTGMRLYTLDDTLVSATWGEDPSVALPGSPYLDMGTASLPFPVKKLKKNARVVDDVPPVGVSVGDVIEYTASFENQGVLPAITVVVVDEMPPRIAYSNNTTRLDGVLIPDNPSGPAMPLVAPGYTIPFTPAGATKIITYFATIVSNTGSLLNNLSADGLTTSNDLSAYVVNTCAVVFTESTRTPVTFYTVGDPLYLELGDEAANTSPFSLQYVTLLVRDITSGDAETVLAQETGPNTGVFFPTNGLPSSSSTGGAYDGVLHADPGDTLLVTYTNLDHMVCSAAAYFRLPAPTNAQTKVLYLSDPAQALDRVDPFAAGDTTTASTTAARRQSFTQAPVFTMPLYMPAGAAVSITTYLALASGTLAATPAVYATLSYNGTMFYTASNPVFSAVVNSSNLVWNGTLPADVNIASNQAITLTITNAVAGANTFSILYDSSNFPSKILLPTTNVINVTSVGVYSLSYPAGTLVASSPTGAVRYVRITATDPFGAYDIKSIALSIDGPGAGADLNVTLTDAQVVASNVLSKTYQYQWQTSTTPGNYVIFATAREGTEGITAQANTTMQLYQPGVRTLSATEFTTGVNGPRTALYQTNELICVRVADNDQNTNGAIQTVRVVIRSSSGDEEIRTLAETAGDSGIFTGAVAAAASGTVVINNGIVIAPAGAALNVSYTDPSDASDVSSDNATVLGAPQTKPLYLSDPAQALDRIDPVAAGSTNTTQTMVLSGGSATITVTATTTNRTANSASLTFSHTAGNGTNRLLIVTVGVGANSLSGSAPALSGVTYGGTAMNLVGSVQSPAQTSANGARSYIYSLTNAAAGPANVVVTAASAASIAAGATTFNNVDQTTPLGVFASSVGISLSGSCTNSSASGELVITTAAWDEGMNNQSITTAGGQTELWNVSGMNYVSAAASTKTGATTVVSSYTSGDATVQEWCMGGVPIKPTSLAGSNSVVFTQAPAFQLPFSLAAGSVITITNFIGVTSGTMPANPSISATLANGGTFLTLSNAVFSSTASNLVWQGALPAAVNIAAGQALTLTIANNQAGVAFRIYYDSSNCPSKVMLPTTNIIGITSVGVYDTSGLPVSSLPQGAARYVRVTVTDPFGAYDIASATLTMVMSGAVSVVNVALSNAYVIASNGWSKTYAYAWTPAVAGTYTIFAMAREGTEGITAQASVTHTVTGAARTPASAEFTASLNGLLTATYPTNVPVYVRITDLDLNTQPGVVETNVALLTETSGDQETITVIETGTNTGVFAGSLPASTFLGQYIEDGILFAPAGSIATVTFVDPVDPADVALATATIATLPLPCKVLYLSEPSNTLDRIDPVASGDGSTTNTAVASRFTFTQAPAFGLPICMSAGDVIVITNYIGIASGTMPSNAAVIAMLSAAGSTFFTASNATYYANGGASNLAWQGTLPADVTIASNQAITLTITNAQAGVTFRILYDSTNCPSKILLPTTNVIHIASLQMYNSAGFAVLGSAINGQTLHIRTTVTDPFGSYDINRLGLTIDGPGSADDVRVMLSNAYVIASNAYAKTYDYTWITPAATGAYTITVVAYEGTEGINDQLAFIQSLTWDGDLTPSTTEFTTGLNGPVTDLYRTNETVCVRVRDYDCNTNATQVENVRVTVTNDTFGDVELLILTEVGPNSGVFTGSVPASTSAGVGATNGVLYAPIGSELLVRYQDYLDPTDVSSDLAVIPLATPALRVHKTMLAPSPDAVIIGALIQFAIRAVNAGNSTQSTVALTDTFPAGALTYLSAIPAPDTTTAGTLTWNNLGPLLPGQQADISVFFTIAATVTNTALATAGSLAATDTYVVAISGPDVTVFKTPLLTGPVAINSIVPYRIVVRNVGATRIATLPLQDIGDSYAYLSATLPPDGQGAGLLLWDNLIASGGYLNVGVAITNDVVLRAIKVGNPAVNEASVTFAYDEYGTPLPNQNYVTGVVVQAASIRGTVYNDLNTNGVYNPGDVGLPNVDITLYTDPLGDGSASNGTLAGGPAQSMTDGSYQFLNLSTGRYVVVETQPLGYVSSSPNRLPVNVTNLADYLNRDFFDYEPPPNTFSTLGGTVYNDFNGNGQRDDGATAVLANVQIDLVEDVNSNGVIDVGEQTTQNAWSGSNGRFQLGAVPVGSWIIFEHDAPGFISTSSNALPVTATAGSTQTNFYFLDHYLPPLVDLTNTNFTVDYEVTSITVAGTNNPTVVGGMWVTNTAGNGSVSTFPAATAWATPLVDVATGVNVIVVYGMNALGVLVSDTVTVTRLLPETALRLTKTASPSSVEPGAQLVYQITVSNASSLAVEHVTVTDTYPARFSADVAQPAGGPSWDLGSLAARTAKTVIIGGYVSTGALAGIRLTNTAAAIVCGPAISTNVITPVIAPTNWPAELVLALSAVPPSATNGQTVVFTLTIGNPGTEAASNVTAAAALPPGLTPVGATSWALGTLPVGATISIVFTGTVSSATVGTILVVPASVTAANAEPKATWVEVKVDPAAGLARLVRVTKTASQTVARPGQTIAYVITVSNAGPAVATNVVVTETFPPLFVFVESAPLASGLGGNEWSFSTLAAGAARQILISGYVVTNATVGERLRNTVVAVATNSVSTNATVEVLVTNPPPATAPLLDLTMLDSADPVTNGQLLIYSLRVQNTGSGWASNVVFNLNFDAKYSVSSLLATNIGTLAPGSEAFLVITGTVVNATAGDVLEQIATVFSSNGQPDTASEQTRVVAILPPQLLVITKTASPDNPMAGGNIVYTIIARNTSAMTATNVTVRENFDGYVTCTNATPAASRQPPPEWEWSLGFIAAGVARTITVVGVVATNVTPGANLRNNVEAWGDNSRKVETNIVNGVIITPFIRITSPGPGLVLPFNVLSCQITGISTGLVGQVVYSNSWTSPGVSGMTAGTLAAASAWSVALHLPHYGSYTFSIVGTNVFGNPVSDSVSFTRNRYNVYLLRNP